MLTEEKTNPRLRLLPLDVLEATVIGSPLTTNAVLSSFSSASYSPPDISSSTSTSIKIG